MNQSASISCVGVNHMTAPTAVREKFYIADKELIERLQILKHKNQKIEFFAVSTCNRFEIFTSAPTTIENEQLVNFFNELHSGLLQNNWKDYLYFYHDQQAITHFIKVTSSLDSMIIGETQITHQIKNALELAHQHQVSGPILNRLGQLALSTAKQVRSQTEIGRRTVSISHTALALANKVFDSLEQKEVWVIGAGEMAKSALHQLKRKTPKILGIINRTFPKAVQLAQDLEVHHVQPLPYLSQCLHNADVVLFAVSSEKEILKKDTLEQIIKSRPNNKPLVLLDIALPRVVDEKCRDLDQVFLFDIDDIQEAVKSNLENRKQAAEQAFIYVENSCKSFVRWLQNKDAAAPIQEYQKYLEHLFEKELTLTLHKQAMRDLNQKQKDDLKALIESIKNKLVADIANGIKDNSLDIEVWLNSIFNKNYKDED